MRFLGCHLLSVIAVCGTASLSLSCTQPGYRNEVYPGAQGQYTLKRVPITDNSAATGASSASGVAQQPTPPAAQLSLQPSPMSTPMTTPMSSAAVAPNVPPAVPASTQSDTTPKPDDGLETVRALWPKLSPSDRAAVIDMTRHLAGQ